jgi:hypothetical protein
MRQALAFVVSACIAVGVVLAIERQRAGSGSDRATSGELVRCQVSSRSLTILTEDGEASFVVADDAIIHEGTKTASLADVCEAISLRVKVRYRESGKARTVHDIRMSLREMASPGIGGASTPSRDVAARQ